MTIFIPIKVSINALEETVIPLVTNVDDSPTFL
jgi:hypothetical protein